MLGLTTPTITTVTPTHTRRFLKQLTFLPLEEINALGSDMASPGYTPNTAQRRLAEEVTRFVHGEEGLQQVGVDGGWSTCLEGRRVL